MNTKIIKDELQWLLEAINEQYETIRKYEDKIPQIEFDILMDNLRKFYDDMRILQRAEHHAGQGEKKKNVPVAEIQVVPEQYQVIPLPSVLQEPVSPPEVTVRFEKPVPATEKTDTPPPPVRETTRKEGHLPARKVSSQGEADLFAAEEPVFSIKLKEAREKTLGPRSSSGRIDDVKSAITINEKFMFINELFEGNLRDYNETIDKLNGFSTLNDASEFLDIMVKKNFWNTGSAAFKKLKELVERRF